MSVPYYIEHGNARYLELPTLEVTKRSRALDSLRRTIRTDAEDTFRDGGALPAFPHMRIKECVSKKDGPGWLHDITAEGLRSGRDKLESSSLTSPAEGWDEGPQVWLTSDPDAFTIGSVHPTQPNLWLVSLDTKEDLNGHIWRVTCTYRGIILDGSGNPKPATWKVTVNGQNISTSGGVTLGSVSPQTFTDEDGNWNGWATSRKGSFDVSKVNLVKTELSTTAPRTDRVGMTLTPEYIPAIYNIFDDTRWFATGFTYNYPAGWKLSGVQSERVLSKELYLYTYTYEYNPIFIPTL